MKCFLAVMACMLGACWAQQYTTPVPILKQINRHNEDGSYSYGYEAADGTFKIETKYPTGEVYGKYGYVDEGGKLREVEYGASRRGFEPAGTGINVPPPTLQNAKAENSYPQPLGPNEEDDGQYREDPSVYYKDDAYNQPAYSKQSYQQPRYQSYQPVQQQKFQQDYQQNYQQPAFRPQPAYNFNTARNYNPVPSQVYNWRGSPATNVDLNSGSYTVNYK